MPICSPRTLRSSASPASISSLPRSRTEPSIREFGERVRPIRVCAVTLLPEPDSPTIASTSPGASSKETPSTACTPPPSVTKPARRSRTDSSASFTRSPSGAPYAAVGRTKRTGSSSCLCSKPDPRVEVGVGDVNQRVEEDDEESAEESDRHDRRQVEMGERFLRVLADAVEVEDR